MILLDPPWAARSSPTYRGTSPARRGVAPLRQGARVEQRGRILAEGDVSQTGRAERPARRIAQYGARGAIVEDRRDCRRRQFPVDRHRHEAGPHRAENAREELGPVPRQDREPIAGLDARCQ